MAPITRHTTVDTDGSSRRVLVVCTATPGADGYEKMRLLSVIGGRRIHEKS